MDHWGDPWADGSESQSPTKEEVKTTEPVTPNVRESVVLSGFLDDAQWGSARDDEEFGGWETSPTFDDATFDTSAETHHPKPTPHLSNVEAIPDIAHEPAIGQGGVYNLGNEGWGSVDADQENSLDSDRVVSETSGSTTTVQADGSALRKSDNRSELGQEDGLSTRSSTSPSDSHTEAPTESPRTSFEDERLNARSTDANGASKVHIDQEAPDIPHDHTSEKEPEKSLEVDGNEVGHMDDIEKQNNVELEYETEPQSSDEHMGDRVNKHSDSFRSSGQSIDPSVQRASIGVSDLDWSLLYELFPPYKTDRELQEANDDPIYSTSARKTWYRLNRRQTMREFNHGGSDDNYVRVTWANSRIRTDVAKIVGRWSSEDRTSGREHATGGMFNWDRPGKSESRTVFTHPMNQTSSPIASPVDQLQPMSPGVPPAFDWSSSSAGADPWREEASTARAVSPSIAPKHNAISRIQGHNPHAVSVDLTSRSSGQLGHKRTITAPSSDLRDVSLGKKPHIDTPTSSNSRTAIQTPSVSMASPSFEAPQSSSPASNGEIEDAGALDIKPRTGPIASFANDDDDDDWGEMVQSPATPTMPKIPKSPTMPPAAPTLDLASAPTPIPFSSSPLASSTSRSASTIVRLKGIVSPTSANFKFNSFVPENAEQGPIGPELLKSKSIAPFRTDRTHPEAIPTIEAEHTMSQVPERFSSEIGGTDNFSTINSGPVKQDICRPIVPSSPSSPSTEQCPSGAIIHDDFSIFEPSASSAAHVPAQLQNQSDSSDPWSIFESAPPPVPEPTPFVRSPQRSITPPLKQPLTNATNSAQKRRDEEDEVIRKILLELPDLGYMLRR